MPDAVGSPVVDFIRDVRAGPGQLDSPVTSFIRGVRAGEQAGRDATPVAQLVQA